MPSSKVTDYLGNEIKVGDRVLYGVSDRYKFFGDGIVTEIKELQRKRWEADRFTGQQVQVPYTDYQIKVEAEGSHYVYDQEKGKYGTEPYKYKKTLDNPKRFIVITSLASS